jgi:hypothetical protein
MGFLDDRIGGKRTIVVSLFGLIGATLLATLARHRPGLDRGHLDDCFRGG